MAAETLSARMLRENAAVFEAMVDHRFVADIRGGRLPEAVFDRYLVYEGAFVETAIAIFAHAVAKAGGIERKRRLIGVLDALANEQVPYFERTLAARGIGAAAIGTDAPGVAAFSDGMLAIARDGGFLDIVAAMFAAEWMYWTWSSRTDPETIADPLLREWVALHRDDAFAAQARWLKDQLDAAGAHLGAEERARLSAIFGRVQELEIAFHDAAYG